MWHGGPALLPLRRRARAPAEHLGRSTRRRTKRRQVTTLRRLRRQVAVDRARAQGRQGEIVFQHGARARAARPARPTKTRAVEVTIPGDRPTLRPRSGRRRRAHRRPGTSRPSGKRALVEARGDVWTAARRRTAAPRNLTRTSGAAERDAGVEPRRQVDRLVLRRDRRVRAVRRAGRRRGARRRASSPTGGTAFRRRLDLVARLEAARLHRQDRRALPARTSTGGEHARRSTRDPWAGDLLATPELVARLRAGSRTRRAATRPGLRASGCTRSTSGEKHRVTAACSTTRSPCFDRKGDYLYFSSRREHFAPLLRRPRHDASSTPAPSSSSSCRCAPTQASPFAPEERRGGGDGREEAEKKDDERRGRTSRTRRSDGRRTAKDDEERATRRTTTRRTTRRTTKDEKPKEPVEIDLEGFERRAVLLPDRPGRLRPARRERRGQAASTCAVPIQGVDGEPAIHDRSTSTDETSPRRSTSPRRPAASRSPPTARSCSSCDEGKARRSRDAEAGAPRLEDGHRRDGHDADRRSTRARSGTRSSPTPGASSATSSTTRTCTAWTGTRSATHYARDARRLRLARGRRAT